jgi:hypothetical protein
MCTRHICCYRWHPKSTWQSKELTATEHNHVLYKSHIPQLYIAVLAAETVVQYSLSHTTIVYSQYVIYPTTDNAIAKLADHQSLMADDESQQRRYNNTPSYLLCADCSANLKGAAGWKLSLLACTHSAL